MSCIMLFLTFCKFGLLCIGGGYMLIPLLILAALAVLLGVFPNPLTDCITALVSTVA